jgi:hypothetical protein
MATTKSSGSTSKSREPTVDRLAAGKDKNVPTLDQRIRQDQDSPPPPYNEDK